MEGGRHGLGRGRVIAHGFVLHGCSMGKRASFPKPAVNRSGDGPAWLKMGRTGGSLLA